MDVLYQLHPVLLGSMTAAFVIGLVLGVVLTRRWLDGWQIRRRFHRIMDETERFLAGSRQQAAGSQRRTN